MSGQQGAINKLESGDVSGALHDIATWIENRVGGLDSQFPELGSLVTRLTADEGAVAYQVAKDAYAAWEGNTPLLTIAESAVTEAATKGLTVAVNDVADWLGLIDRSSPNASSSASTAQAAS